MSKLQSIINIGVATALPRLAEKYDPKVVLKALQGRGQIFAGHLGTALEQAINMMLVLEPRGSTTVTLTEEHDPVGFYLTRSGLYIWDDFWTDVVLRAKPTVAGTTFRVESYDMMQCAADKVIEGALPKVHLFNETGLCAIVAGLIARQLKGEKGELVNNGCSNLLYLHSCVVDVCWSVGFREWDVHAWRRDGVEWDAGGRVFSPAN
ncbi:MAG: hypothetical protein Q7R69_01345 [bacterium]|nr:hypothetical protein [bacterium]